jgi:hypothetical protein
MSVGVVLVHARSGATPTDQRGGAHRAKDGRPVNYR